jgi:hypothetical protein
MGTSDIMMRQNLLIDSFDPFHVGDGVLGVNPVLRIAAAQFVDESLQLIAISSHAKRIYTTPISSECGEE